MTIEQMPRGIWREVSVQRIGRETLVYDGVRHRAFCLNESSGVVWRLADGTRTVENIVAAARVELGSAMNAELVDCILDELRGDGLIEVARDEGEMRAVVSRRVMLERLGVGGAMLLPVIAAIVAPTAAQAYSGCVDCDASQAKSKARRAQRSQTMGSSPDSLAEKPSD